MPQAPHLRPISRSALHFPQCDNLQAHGYRRHSRVSGPRPRRQPGVCSAGPPAAHTLLGSRTRRVGGTTVAGATDGAHNGPRADTGIQHLHGSYTANLLQNISLIPSAIYRLKQLKILPRRQKQPSQQPRTRTTPTSTSASQYSRPTSPAVNT